MRGNTIKQLSWSILETAGRIINNLKWSECMALLPYTSITITCQNVLPWKQLYSPWMNTYALAFLFIIWAKNSLTVSIVDLFSKKDCCSNQFYTWLQFDKMQSVILLLPSVYDHLSLRITAVRSSIWRRRSRPFFIYERSSRSFSCSVVLQLRGIATCPLSYSRCKDIRLAGSSLKNRFWRQICFRIGQDFSHLEDAQARSKKWSNIETAKSLCFCQ